MKFKYCMSMNKDPTKLHEENNEIFVFRETGETSVIRAKDKHFAEEQKKRTHTPIAFI